MSKRDLRPLKILEKPYKYFLKKVLEKKKRGRKKNIHKKLKCKGLKT
jgi:hypothetical protein